MPNANQRRGLRPVVKWGVVILIVFTLGFFVRGCWNEGSGLSVETASESKAGETALQREVRLLKLEQAKLEEVSAGLKASLKDAEEAAEEEAKLARLIDEREEASKKAQEALQKARRELKQWVEGLELPVDRASDPPAATPDVGSEPDRADDPAPTPPIPTPAPTLAPPLLPPPSD